MFDCTYGEHVRAENLAEKRGFGIYTVGDEFVVWYYDDRIGGAAGQIELARHTNPLDAVRLAVAAHAARH